MLTWSISKTCDNSEQCSKTTMNSSIAGTVLLLLTFIVMYLAFTTT
jgi:hypothetical protein